jgi:hypothetical protein
MPDFFYGWSFTLLALAIVATVFAVGFVSLHRELGYVKALADYLGYDLVTAGHPEASSRPEPSLRTEALRDEVEAIRAASDPAWAQKHVRSWEMRAQRLEPALAFWVDFLRQLGLLFTVLGLGLSLAVERASVEELLSPLGLAVWTTVAGLFFSVWLTAQFGMKMAVWADTCEKNIEAWNARRQAEKRE